MFETVGVLVVFFFLLATGSIIYFGAQKSSLQKEKVKAAEDYAFQTVLKSLYLPELDCSFLVTSRDNCIDKIKLQKLSEIIQTTEQARVDYYTQFGYATIKVNEVYPGKQETTIFDVVPTQLQTVNGEEKEVPTYTSKITTQNPILLYDAMDNTYSFGIIEVSVYVE